MQTEKKLVSGLLDWFEENKRDYAWRYNKTPYRVLVSEIFLQQTFADKVEPVFKIIVDKYRTFEELGKADISILQEIIKPLGLIYRAKLLTEISNVILDDFEGKVPNKKMNF